MFSNTKFIAKLAELTKTIPNPPDLDAWIEEKLLPHALEVTEYDDSYLTVFHSFLPFENDVLTLREVNWFIVNMRERGFICQSFSGGGTVRIVFNHE